HLASGRKHPLVAAAAVGRAELALQVGCARQAGRRHVRVQLEGAPAQGRRRKGRIVLPPQFDGLLELALADVTPRAHDIGDDVDLENSRRFHAYILRSGLTPTSYP